MIEEQAEWLESVLKDNPNKWTIATYHHPIFSASRGRDNVELRSLWKPLFDKYKVDLALQGHDHTYTRGRVQPYETNIVDGENVKYGQSEVMACCQIRRCQRFAYLNRGGLSTAAVDT